MERDSDPTNHPVGRWCVRKAIICLPVSPVVVTARRPRRRLRSSSNDGARRLWPDSQVSHRREGYHQGSFVTTCRVLRVATRVAPKVPLGLWAFGAIWGDEVSAQRLSPGLRLNLFHSAGGPRRSAITEGFPSPAQSPSGITHFGDDKSPTSGLCYGPVGRGSLPRGG
jgi:hypothetical protein